MDSSGTTDSLETNDVGAENTTSSNQESAEAGEGTADSPRKEKGPKVFCDPVHGHISLHPLLAQIVDTPQFQRLRHIRQLGSTYFVYPGASHNRFEHCIGTAHLAGKLARKIQQQINSAIDKKIQNGGSTKEEEEKNRVTDVDVLCVEMAGLCHDLGHGPFSHMFDDVILRRLRPEYKWSHEKGSCDMFDHLIKVNNLRKDVVDEITETGLIFVKEMIDAKKFKDDDPWPYKGRGEEKSFLYEIISNKRNGVDMDKWDYFARDCHHLGIENSFDHNRFMEFIEVKKFDKERLQICARDKECENLYGMFQTRSLLHRRAYQHKVAKQIDCMIGDAMVLANSSITILGKKDEDGKRIKRKISECVDDPEAYTKLTDRIFDRIAYSNDPNEKSDSETEVGNDSDEDTEPDTPPEKKIKRNLKKARKILDRVSRRQLYKRVGIIKPYNKKSTKSDDESVLSQISECDVTKQLKMKKRGAKEPDLILCRKTVNYGMGSENPVNKFKFFSKSGEEKHMKKEHVSVMLPEKFEECEALIFCRDSKKDDVAEESFKIWDKKAKDLIRLLK